MHHRYQSLGNLLKPSNNQYPPDNDNVGQGLNVVTNRQVRAVLLESAWTDPSVAALELLCLEFGLKPQNGSGVGLWGHFEQGQLLPEHMYVTIGGKIYDTMPEAPVRKSRNEDGLNPPSYGGKLLSKKVVFFVEIEDLAAGTKAVVNTSDEQWEEGMG